MAKTLYFLGIGGIGMSALARFFMQRGDTVYGYDLTPSPITQKLEEEGAHIHYTEDVSAIPLQVDFVVYTPAVPSTHAELVYFHQHGTPVYKRSQVLGHLAQGHPTLAVAGTHGKTTTTAMLAQLLAPYRHLLAFIGGVAKNFDSNVILTPDYDTVVAEADEFDRSFLTLFPTLAIITSLDADHLDIYGDRQHLVESFQLFADQTDRDGHLLIHEKVADQISHPHKLIYGTGEHCEFRIADIVLGDCQAHFTLHTPDGQQLPVTIGVSGTHNVLNAAAAVAAGHLIGLTPAQIQERMAAFCGVKRRFDYRIRRDDLIYIDDYAHHPEEIRAILNAVKKLYADKELTVIFQPHLYTRTRDFGSQFAEVLALADRVILLDIYPAREKPIPGITSQWLLDMIHCDHKVLIAKEKVVPYLQQNRPQVLLTVGAGDIDRLVKPITENL
jgi:UDP-N-acetylmuramate--alanine ligase